MVVGPLQNWRALYWTDGTNPLEKSAKFKRHALLSLYEGSWIRFQELSLLFICFSLWVWKHWRQDSFHRKLRFRRWQVRVRRGLQVRTIYGTLTFFKKNLQRCCFPQIWVLHFLSHLPNLYILIENLETIGSNLDPASLLTSCILEASQCLFSKSPVDFFCSVLPNFVSFILWIWKMIEFTAHTDRLNC